MDIQSSCITTSDPGISYPSIFQLNLEIPAFYANYRWWEDEATTVFWAFDIQEISRVIQFGLFDDESVPRTSLCARNVDTIDTFLMALSEPHEYQLLGNLSHTQRVEEILRRSSISPFQAIPWSWLPPQSSPTLDALEIATAIEAESHFHFRQIAFEEFARAALGYKAVFVEWFLQQHTALYIILRDHLSAYPGDIPLYTEVEKHLRSRSPFAHRALVHCLLAVQTGGPHYDMSKLHTAGFEFIAGPIQALFMGQQGRLTAMLKMLSVLAIRFRRQYIHPPTMDWKTPFQTSIPFLDDYLDSTSPADLARTMRGADEHLFAELTRESLITEDVVVRRLQIQWRTLSTSVWECCSALPDLIPYLQECAKSLLTTRNYHSFTAIIKGLHTYSILTTRTNKATAQGNMITLEALVPQVMVALMNPAQNFAAYRDHYQLFPGIPFLMPHIHDFEQNGESVLEPVFKHLQSTQ